MTVTRYPQGASSLDGLGDVAVSSASRGQIIAHNGTLFRNRSQGVFDVRDWGALGDGATDDTAAIQAAIDACTAAGGGTVFFPKGTFRVNTVSSPGSNPWILSVVGHNVTIQGSSGAVLETPGNAAFFQVIGGALVAGTVNWNNAALVDATIYPMGAVTKNAMSVTTANPANAGNFAAGDWVYLRTGQTAAGLVEQPDAEINRVAAGGGNPATGAIPLVYPTCKPYAQEYFISGTTGKTSTAVTANPAVFGIAKVTDRIIQNFAIRNLTLRGLSVTTGGALLCRQIAGFEVTDCDFQTSNGVNGNSGSYRDYKFLRNRVSVSAPATTRWWAATDTACSDAEIAHNRVVAAYTCYLHIHEGSSRINAHDNEMMMGAGDGVSHAVSVAGRAYDITISRNHIVANGANTGIFVNEDCTGGGTIADNTVIGSYTSSAVGIACANWYEVGTRPTSARVNIFSNVSGLSPVGGCAPREYMVSPVWVADNDQNPSVVGLPDFCVVDRVEIDVTQAFNSDGTDQISVGIDGTTEKFGTLTDVSTTGKKTVTGGSGLGRYQVTTQTVKAFYVNGGSEPTTGKALVEVHWHRSAREVT